MSAYFRSFFYDTNAGFTPLFLGNLHGSDRRGQASRARSNDDDIEFH